MAEERIIAGRWLVAPVRTAINNALEGRALAADLREMTATRSPVESLACTWCSRTPAGRNAALVLGPPEVMAAAFIRPGGRLVAPVLCTACQQLEDAVLLPVLEAAEAAARTVLRRRASVN